MANPRERCRAVVHLDRAELEAEATRQDFIGAAGRGLPMHGYGIALDLALRALAGARSALDRVKCDDDV